MADNTLRIAINADIRGLNQNLSKAQSKLKAFGSKMQAVGSQLQSRLALPLIAGGGAAIKMAADFDKSMTKIKTLVGIAGADVDAMSGSVKSLATNAGVSSGEAADALFFITSAGLRGSDAMEVLEQSTKAAALGLGETKVVADLATSALNAYGSENLSAVQATDILTAAVREGKLEASELSSVMGQVLPTASNMGVAFHEVGAAFAAMSRTGTPAAQAATQLNGIMMAIMKPTQQSAQALEELGLSSQGLRQQIREEGLLSVLGTLKDASNVNAEAFERVFGNVRALKGILDLTGASANVTAEIFTRMSDTTGITSQAFDELQNSAEFKLRKSLVAVKNAFSETGAVLMSSLLPAITNVLGFVQGLFQAFASLDPVTQQVAIGLGVLAAALPTILTIGGAIIGVFSALLSPIGLVVAGIAAVAYVIYKNWDEVLPVIVGLYNRFVDLYNASEGVRIAVALLKTAFQAAFIGIKAQIDQVINVFTTMWTLIKKVAGEESKSFGEILEEGFNNAVDITAKAGEDVANTFTENMAAAIESRLEYQTVDSVKRGLSNAVNSIKSFIPDWLSGIGIKQPTTAIAAPKAETKIQAPVFMGTQDFEKEANAIDLIWKDLNESVKSTIEGGLLESFSAIGEGLGAALSGTKGAMKNLGEVLLGGLADMLMQLGKMAIQTGVTLLGINIALKSLNPAVAIAAGVALVALAGAVKSNIAKVSEKKGGGGIPKFANGGIITGPTLGLMGEYSGARSNPEVIAPLDKLRGMIGQQGQNVTVGGEFRIQGQDLVVALQRAERNRSRIK